MRHYEQAHLLSNIEKLPLPIWGSMFPFWNPTGVFLQSVAHVELEKDKPSLFVASLQSTSFVVSPAEGEGAPGSSGPVHSGRSGPTPPGAHWPQAESRRNLKPTKPGPAIQISDADRKRKILITDKCNMAFKKWREKGRVAPSPGRSVTVP